MEREIKAERVAEANLAPYFMEPPDRPRTAVRRTQVWRVIRRIISEQYTTGVTRYVGWGLLNRNGDVAATIV